MKKNVCLLLTILLCILMGCTNQNLQSFTSGAQVSPAASENRNQHNITLNTVTEKLLHSTSDQKAREGICIQIKDALPVAGEDGNQTITFMIADPEKKYDSEIKITCSSGGTITNLFITNALSGDAMLLLEDLMELGFPDGSAKAQSGLIGNEITSDNGYVYAIDFDLTFTMKTTES